MKNTASTVIFKTKYVSSVNLPMKASLRRLSYKGSLKSPNVKVLMTVYATVTVYTIIKIHILKVFKNNQILKLKTDDG